MTDKIYALVTTESWVMCDPLLTHHNAFWLAFPTTAEIAAIFDNPDDRDRFDADAIAKIVSGGQFRYSTDESEYAVFITEYPVGRAL